MVAPGTTGEISTISTGFSRRNAGRVRSMRRASQRNRSRSRANARAMPGPQHLDRDLLALGRTAKCTCAIDAAAIGASSNVGNSSASRQPNSASISARASLAGKRRQLVLQQGQIGGDFVAEQVGARRQHLAELDEAGPIA